MLNVILFSLIFCHQVNSKMFDLIEEIDLEKVNYVTLEGTIESDMANEVISNIFEQDDDFYMYINSNGGDVESGLKIVKMMKYTKHNNIKITCIANKAMSMAFHIFQHCDERLITPKAILMQHEMIVYLGGSIDETQELLQKYIKWNNEINIFDRQRIKMDLNMFLAELKNEIWLTGDDIIINNAADRKIILK